ncbi:MAG: hypothetical protein IPN90_02610 [Elusimicrobia bacterium]|nr:hypothetical protein [Elusimicrobiota bacterium]
MTEHYDYYKEAKSISEALKIEGQKKWAKLIIDKIEAGSTSTEILMGLRWVLQECLKTRDCKLGNIEISMLGLVSKIDGALK